MSAPDRAKDPRRVIGPIQHVSWKGESGDSYETTYHPDFDTHERGEHLSSLISRVGDKPVKGSVKWNKGDE